MLCRGDGASAWQLVRCRGVRSQSGVGRLPGQPMHPPDKLASSLTVLPGSSRAYMSPRRQSPKSPEARCLSEQGEFLGARAWSWSFRRCISAPAWRSLPASMPAKLLKRPTHRWASATVQKGVEASHGTVGAGSKLFQQAELQMRVPQIRL